MEQTTSIRGKTGTSGPISLIGKKHCPINQLVPRKNLIQIASKKKVPSRIQTLSVTTPVDAGTITLLLTTPLAISCTACAQFTLGQLAHDLEPFAVQDYAGRHLLYQAIKQP
ncbi:hypothetical protein [Chitinimonas sp. BJB300]|uniref:hypothetical protein n=1 Tax=Chitinimonas sp. BJB300 TaxID=1559339 RepID=UPI0011127EC3|nr:hypothetical protein [Chitinimonas sp. BJB300]TSJ91063.1 hypothetical protein FG002_001785 [Chitinimonas sp. BJB300]